MSTPQILADGWEQIEPADAGWTYVSFAVRTLSAHDVMTAVVTGATVPGQKGASPKFSRMTPSKPASASTSASLMALSIIPWRSPSKRGLPGSGRR